MQLIWGIAFATCSAFLLLEYSFRFVSFLSFFYHHYLRLVFSFSGRDSGCLIWANGHFHRDLDVAYDGWYWDRRTFLLRINYGIHYSLKSYEPSYVRRICAHRTRFRIALNCFALSLVHFRWTGIQHHEHHLSTDRPDIILMSSTNTINWNDSNGIRWMSNTRWYITNAIDHKCWANFN